MLYILLENEIIRIHIKFTIEAWLTRPIHLTDNNQIIVCIALTLSIVHFI